MFTRLNGSELGLVGYWRFDEGSGQTIHDMSPCGNDGYLGNAAANPDGADPTWITSTAPVGSGVLAPAIVQSPADVTLRAGHQVALTVDVIGSSPLFQWRRNGSPLVDSARISGVAGATLTIDPAVGNDAGSYDVVVSNTCDSATSAAGVITVTCPGDITGDGITSLDDLAVLLSHFGDTAGATFPTGDVDGDGDDDLGDLAAFLAAFGTVCP